MENIKKKQFEIFEILLEARFQKRLTQQDVASIAGLNINTVSRLEANKYSPKVETLLQICEALDLQIIIKKKNEKN